MSGNNAGQVSDAQSIRGDFGHVAEDIAKQLNGEELRGQAVSDAVQQFVKDNEPSREELSNDDIRRLAGGRNRSNRQDPGIVAKERLQARMAKVRRAAVKLYLALTTLVIAAILGACGYVYAEYTKITPVRHTDYRTCSYVNEQHGVTITGKREYSYKKRSLFGVEWRVSDEVTEKTQIDINGSPITVVGMRADGTWWGRYSDLGERGILMLDAAQTYVFTTNKAAGVIDYEAFCR